MLDGIPFIIEERQETAVGGHLSGWNQLPKLYIVLCFRGGKAVAESVQPFHVVSSKVAAYLRGSHYWIW